MLGTWAIAHRRIDVPVPNLTQRANCLARPPLIGVLPFAGWQAG
jgi:hypothetical protein